MRHLTDEELTAYAIDPEQVPDREYVEAHLQSCVDCRTDLDIVREPDQLLTHDEAWSTQPEDDAGGKPNGLQQLRLLETQKRDEYERAKHLLRRPLRSHAAFAALMVRLKTQPKYRFGGVVQLLIDTAHERCESDALHARDLANTAVVISQLLPVSKYSFDRLNELLGSAWKEHAQALRFNNEWEEALKSLDNAERAFRNIAGNQVLPLAQVDNIRAGVFAEDEARRYEALALSRSAARVFKHFGQDEQYAVARHTEATVLFELGEWNAAEVIAEEEFEHAEKAKKVLWRARGLLLLANVQQARGHSRIAFDLAETAIPIFRAAGLDVEVLRSEWVVARATFGRGLRREGVAKLRRVRSRFFEHDLVPQAALATLDLIECLSSLGQPSEILSVADGLVKELTKVGVTSAATTAANYLREAATRGDITPSLVDHLRRFFRRFEFRSNVQFTPLQNPG